MAVEWSRVEINWDPGDPDFWVFELFFNTPLYNYDWTTHHKDFFCCQCRGRNYDSEEIVEDFDAPTGMCQDCGHLFCVGCLTWPEYGDANEECDEYVCGEDDWWDVCPAGQVM
ncbi:hypothetical protein BU26DRAFT_567420 [Trematosphaeria pertusa]|uniref:RING-type domain-containing protein n=1 Tax=Trematosphaeria pertusa TaxID=390896 RepID=A0A6A6I5T9_9PLEO|nr:uncharacterized protein BU26DRAFT_567420 [Trematosphaeria pertusa]KAF2245904.1 hypothetical protein BU26DRAFT_567420 [Trematosphaeria pertusa]